jgi:DNA-binding PadR family transcriptional regulator
MKDSGLGAAQKTIATQGSRRRAVRVTLGRATAMTLTVALTAGARATSARAGDAASAAGARSGGTASSAAICATSCSSSWGSTRPTATSSSAPWKIASTASAPPSPGVVYPTLQWLEDLGYVTAAEGDGRKVVTITAEGRRFLGAGGPRIAAIDEHARGWMGPFDHQEYRTEVERIQQDLEAMSQALRVAGRRSTPERLRRVHDFTHQARQAIEDILRQPDAQPGQDAPVAPTAG